MGMITMDASLTKLFKEGKISFDDVMTYSYDPVSTRAELVAQGLIDEAVKIKKDSFSK